MSASASGFERLREIGSRRWALGLTAAAAVVALGAGLVLGLPNVYQASASVLVEHEPTDETAAPAELESRLHVIGQEILSRARLTELITRFNLYPRLRAHGSQLDAVARLQKDIRIDAKEALEPGGRGVTAGFTVTYRGTEPATVAGVTNAIAAFYVEENQRLRAGEAETIATQLQDVRTRLEEQERRLGRFRAEHTGELPQQQDMNLATLQRLDSQLRMANEGRVRAMERREALSKQLADTDASGTGDPDAVDARITKLNTELAGMRQRFTEKYPDVQRLKAEIASLEKQSATARTAPKTPPADAASRSLLALKDSLHETDGEIRSLSADEASLRRDLDTYRRRMDAAPMASDALLTLSRDYDATRTLYGALLKRYETARLDASGGADRGARAFRVLEPAVPPAGPAAPNRPRFLAIVLALGLAAGFAAIVVAEHVDSSFHSRDDLRGFTHVPVLVSIPLIASPADLARQRRRRWLAAVSVVLALGLFAQASYHLARGRDDLVVTLLRGRTS